MASQIKKLKTEELPSKPFTESGEHDDEVTLVFGVYGSEKKLFVPRSFLCIASPVFEAMFTHNFREKTQKSIKMTGKNYDTFLDFLLCIHPRIQKPVEVSNALCIVPLAEEYQVTSIVEKCKTVMKSVLSQAVEKGNLCITYQLKSVRNCFYVLESANSLNYTEIVTLAVEAVARFGYCHYSDEKGCNDERKYYSPSLRSSADSESKETYGDIRNRCVTMFNNLPSELRCRILSKRLTVVNDDNLK